MKMALTFLSLLIATSAWANDTVSVSIAGDQAQALYNSLQAPLEIDPGSNGWTTYSRKTDKVTCWYMTPPRNTNIAVSYSCYVTVKVK